MTFKNLSQVVLDALSLHASCALPSIELPPARQRLVVASGNALPTARILFPESNTTFCSESGYRSVLDADSSLDARNAGAVSHFAGVIGVHPRHLTLNPANH